MFEMRLASFALSFGRKILLNPFSFAKLVIGRMPLIGLTSPLRASSPITMDSSNRSRESWLDAARIARAIGRSKLEPCFLSSAGARLMVFLSMGNLKPLFLMAERTRSFDS